MSAGEAAVGAGAARAPAWKRAGSWVLGLPPAYGGTVVLIVIAAIFRPQLLSPFLLFLIMRQAAPLGLAVIGQSLVMRSLSLDLSIGGVVVASTYILTSGLISVPEWGLIGLCLLLGLAVGSVNGVIITRLRAPAVIVTLAMALVLTGIVFAFTQTRAPGSAPELLRYIGTTRIGIVPVAPFVWFAIVVPAALFVRYSVFGRYLDAVGANPRAATVSGVPHLRIVFLCHVVSALMSVISAFLLVGYVGYGDTQIGQDLALNSLAAVILGGVNFGSGRGGMMGPAVAAFMLTFLFNFLTSFGLGEPGKLMMQGGIIALAALAYSLRNRR